jgi:signal recognition particle subunit SRP54
MEMMGLVNLPKDMIETSEEKMKVYQFIMDSMSKKELEDPDLIDNSRIKRIAKGAGTKEKDVKELLKQYKMSKKMLKKLKGGKLPKKMKALGKMAGLPAKFKIG